MIPDGPLHPTDAAVAFAAGSLVAVAVRRTPRRWVVAVLATFVAVVEQRHDGLLLDAIRDRPSPVMPVVMGACVVAVASVHVDHRRPPTMRVVLPVLVALGVLWARVPDTEVPLIAAAVLAGASPWLRPRDRSRCAGLLVILPVSAALTGTIGRVDRLASAALAALTASVAVYLAMTLISRSTRWAGTPTTVVAAPTSSRTTAPAPTTAP